MAPMSTIYLPPPNLHPRAFQAHPGTHVGLVAGLGHDDLAARLQDPRIGIREHLQERRGRGPQNHLALMTAHENTHRVVSLLHHGSGALGQLVTRSQLDIAFQHVVPDSVCHRGRDL